MPNYPVAHALAPDGITNIFVLPSVPIENTLLVLFNSTVQRGNWTLVQNTLTLSWVPAADDQLLAYYTDAATAPFSGGAGGGRFDPEVIANALFVLLGMVNFPFVSMSRRGAIWSNLPAGAQPYLALVERGGTGVQNQALGLEKWTLHFVVLVYIRADADPSDIPATNINGAWKAIADVMNSAPMGERQTLGGIVNNAWINGEVAIDTGILDQQCALVIPVDVECGI